MTWVIVLYAAAACAISFAGTAIIKKLAERWRVVDVANEPRKKHERPVPLLGGVAIFVSFWLVAGYLLMYDPRYDVDIFRSKLLGLFLASLIIVVMGAWDDIRRLSPAIR